MRSNGALEKLRSGQTVFGCAIQCYGVAEIPRLLAAVGFDYFFIDAEHGGFDLETIRDLVLAGASAGITPLVRVCELLYSQVARVLDLGAQGVIYPRVEDPVLLEKAVRWAHFPPEGVRGFGVLPPLLDYSAQPVDQVMDHCNRNVMVVVQFETRAALERADELLAVKGVDVAMVGPTDLSISLGVPGQFQSPLLVDAVCGLMEKCRRYGVYPGIHCRSAEAASDWVEQRMQFIGAGSEQSFLTEKAREACQLLHSRLQPR